MSTAIGALKRSRTPARDTTQHSNTTLHGSRRHWQHNGRPNTRTKCPVTSSAQMCTGSRIQSPKQRRQEDNEHPEPQGTQCKAVHSRTTLSAGPPRRRSETPSPPLRRVALRPADQSSCLSLRSGQVTQHCSTFRRDELTREILRTRNNHTSTPRPNGEMFVLW